MFLAGNGNGNAIKRTPDLKMGQLWRRMSAALITAQKPVCSMVFSKGGIHMAQIVGSSNKITQYRSVAALGNIRLPQDCREILFDDFSIKECPNHSDAKEYYDEETGVHDIDWVYPEKPDTRFPISDYMFEKYFSSESGKGWQRGEWELAWALTRLRLFRVGRLWGSLYRVSDMASTYIQGEDIDEAIKRRPKEPPQSGLSLPGSGYYKIQNNDLVPLQDFVNNLGKVKVTNFEVAIRRFHQSFDRDLAQDRAIDLFIALESLLSEDSEAIGYKIALRAAHLTENDRSKRGEISTFLKKAYKERSNIVHGKKSTGTNIGELEDIVRRVLEEILKRAQQGEIVKAEQLDNILFFSPSKP